MHNVEELVKLDLLDFHSFFTKYSLMEEFGYTSGIIIRIFRKILPDIPDRNTVEFVLLKRENPVSYVMSLLDFKSISSSTISQQLDLSIKTLCARVSAFGLDSHVKAKNNFLKLNSKPFEKLLEKSSSLSQYSDKEAEELNNYLESIEKLINDLRKNKSKIGTNFHLTLTTRRILECTKRIKELLDLKMNITSEKHWEKMFIEYIAYAKQKDSISRYIGRHSDLVAQQMVEHTSNKGEKYIAENREEYWNFFQRSMLGGGIIALFSLFKLYIVSYGLSPLANAFYFSLNYAICFVIVNLVGGIIATKQPAMTASTIAKNINAEGYLKKDSMVNITAIVRKVFRSQFISVMGNFLMAVITGCAIIYALQLYGKNDLTEITRPEYLIYKIIPSFQTVFYAAVAGVFLALSGLISGYIDNQVVSSKIAHRILNNKVYFNSQRLASFFHNKAGVLFGNISLGIFLGSTFLLSYILPLQIDIRHVAFSSANVGFSIMTFDFAIDVVLFALAGALLIGFVNFIVSFSITLFLALKSREADFKIMPKILGGIFKDFLFNPLYYFVKIEKEPTVGEG